MLKKVKLERDAEKKRADELEERVECVVCNELTDDRVLFMPCKHICACKACGDKIWAANRECPMCRRRIQRRVVVF